jgi:hypothetical protein
MKKIFCYICIIVVLATLSVACEKESATDDQETTTDSRQVLFIFQTCNVVNDTDTTWLDPAGAAVIIYDSIGNESADGITDPNGEVIFRLPKGNYGYLLLENGRETLSNDGYEIVGIFNSQEEINNALTEQPGATVGGQRYADLNGDGLIDEEDKLTNYRIDFQIEDRDTSIVHLIVTFENIALPITIGEDIIIRSLGTLSDFFHREVLNESYKIDAAITHQASEPIEMAYRTLYLFNVYPNNAAINRLYNNASSLISKSNSALHALNSIDSDETVLVRFALYRAYAYSILLNYFGGTPLITEMAQNPHPARNTEAEVAQFILSEADRIYDSGDDNLRRFALQLKARIAANTGNHQAVIEATKAIMAAVGNAGNEAVWDEYDWGDPDKGAAFDENASSAVLPMRYTETLLLCAEALAMSGRTAEAKETVNTICNRHSLPPADPNATPDEIKNRIFELWKTLLNNEGFEYAHLKRTGKFQEVLGNYGAQPHHRYLPIPMSEIDRNPNLTQNPGY